LIPAVSPFRRRDFISAKESVSFVCGTGSALVFWLVVVFMIMGSDLGALVSGELTAAVWRISRWELKAITSLDVSVTIPPKTEKTIIRLIVENRIKRGKFLILNFGVVLFFISASNFHNSGQQSCITHTDRPKSDCSRKSDKCANNFLFF